jgi:hypothetical protein
LDGVAGGAGPSHDPAMGARVAVLEEIAASTKEALTDLRQELRALRTETSRRDDGTREAQERDFRILFAALISVAIGLAAMMAKGFHWF